MEASLMLLARSFSILEISANKRIIFRMWEESLMIAS